MDVLFQPWSCLTLRLSKEKLDTGGRVRYRRSRCRLGYTAISLECWTASRSEAHTTHWAPDPQPSIKRNPSSWTLPGNICLDHQLALRIFHVTSSHLYRFGTKRLQAHEGGYTHSSTTHIVFISSLLMAFPSPSFWLHADHSNVTVGMEIEPMNVFCSLEAFDVTRVSHTPNRPCRHRMRCDPY